MISKKPQRRPYTEGLSQSSLKEISIDTDKILFVTPTRLEASILDSCQGVENLLITGIGPVNMGINLCECLLKNPTPQLIILFGLCGLFKEVSHDFRIGEVVLAKKEKFGDLGRCGDSISHIEIKGDAIDYEITAPDFESLPIIGKTLKSLSLKVADMATCMCTSASHERASNIYHFTNAQCENMEGAAFFLVSRKFNIPFLEVRSISNIAGDSREHWRIDLALDSLKSFFERLFK
ncbi:Menaquinone via futalosine step 2 [Dissulfuribacter thermophilus]|uniref:Menaquinone via futalosine step 2 n=1 Tax=Dissulfuribacter thermophilus TaxID=1156395 RepID=A0A1B9F3L8_9BACT|nr:hypothetical protein [Dissulfuribacter thermophilus]OCC14415.1 Menaquinone via futalosine step 2 [Dissulfuribacter thermophilus]